MIELTLVERKAVATNAERPRVIDPSTHTKYVLVREELYDRVRQVFDADDESQFVHEMTPHVMEVLGREGWDESAMDIYNELDPRIQP